MIKQFAFIAYSVRDVARAAAFYRDVIGLKPGGMASDYWVEFDVGNATFGVGNGEPLGIPIGQAASMVLEVDDLDAQRVRIVAAGAQVGDLYDNPTCRMFFVTDPDGNRLALHQRKT